MKIVSWNCNCKFREKFKAIQKLDADIYVIQECENPNTCSDLEYKSFSSNYLWIGQNDNKGLGIFAKNDVDIKLLNWESYCLRYFLPVRINNKFNLLGVWACSPYIKEYYVYQNINFNKFNKRTIIIGDFNSNVIWDKQSNYRNHKNTVKELETKGLTSIYHFVTNEKQGEEIKKTFYLYRNKSKGYHIDHCFCDKEIVKKYTVFSPKEWLNLSDHIPLLLEIEDK